MKHGLFVIVLTLGCSSADPGTRATSRAYQIGNQGQVIGGPKALGTIGDYMLENDQIRVVIHGLGPNRGNTVFGGSLIDADLVRPQGSGGRGGDLLGEITPAFFLESFAPTAISVPSDGSEGGAASVLVKGTGGDLLQLANLLNDVVLGSDSLSFRVEYRLPPGKRYVEIVTTIQNNTGMEHLLPGLSGPEIEGLLSSFGIEVPGVSLSVPLGQLALFGADVEPFAQGRAGYDVRYSILDEYPRASGLPAFPGLVTEYIAATGDGVSYGLAVPSSPETNYPTAFKDLYGNQTVTDHSMVLPFVFASVTAVFHTNPPEVLGPGEAFTYTTYFIVGRGDVASITDVIADIRGTTTGRFAGRVLDDQTLAPVAHASVLVSDTQGNYVTQIDSDERGTFQAQLPPGDYAYRIQKSAYTLTSQQAFTVQAGKSTWKQHLLESPATVSVLVLDDTGRPAPARVALVGRFDEADQGRDPRDFLFDLSAGESRRPTAFDQDRNEFIEGSWYTDATGTVSFQVRPGRYDLVVVRGMELDMHTEPVVLESGKAISRSVQLRRTVETNGWISGDFHMHAANSTDSDVSLRQRVLTVAGEGVEYVVASDHNVITDYAPAIAAMNLVGWLSSSVGNEVTSFEMGHFNGYPLRVDPGNVRGGDILWAGKTPQEVFDQIRAHGSDGPENTIVQVNHPRQALVGYFAAFNLDPIEGVARAASGALSAILSPSGAEFQPSAFSYDFDVIEVLNGIRIETFRDYVVPDPLPPPPLPDPVPTPGEVLRDAEGRAEFPGTLQDWFMFLNRGLAYTAVGNSDSHHTLGDEPGFPRTFVWVGEGNDFQGKFTDRDIVRGLKDHRAVISMGPMIHFTVNDQPVGATVAPAAGGKANLGIRVQSPNYAPFDRIKIWQGGELVRELMVPEAERHDFAAEEIIDVPTDTWFVIEVTGSKSMFPVVSPLEFEPIEATIVLSALLAGIDTALLNPNGNARPETTFQVTPLAFTNPIWIDTDGNGSFDASLPDPRKSSRSALKPQNLRSLYESLPEAR